MKVKILAGPSALPVSLIELRQYLRIGSQEEDTILEILLNAAIERVEADSFRAIMHQKLRQNFGRDEIISAMRSARSAVGRILLRPARLGVTSIDAVRILNADGDLAIAPADFVKISNECFEIASVCLGLEIDYFAGVNDAALVTNETKIQIMEKALRLYNARENDKETANVAGVRL